MPPPSMKVGSFLSLSTAWNAPRALKTPIRCRFSHLNHSRITGFAGFWPLAPWDLGVDAMVFNARLVSTGVRWIRCLIRSWALRVDSLVKGKHVESSAMMDDGGNRSKPMPLEGRLLCGCFGLGVVGVMGSVWSRRDFLWTIIKGNCQTQANQLWRLQ